MHAVGNIGNFWLITKNPDFGPKKVDLMNFHTFLNFYALKGPKIYFFELQNVKIGIFPTVQLAIYIIPYQNGKLELSPIIIEKRGLNWRANMTLQEIVAGKEPITQPSQDSSMVAFRTGKRKVCGSNPASAVGILSKLS